MKSIVQSMLILLCMMFFSNASAADKVVVIPLSSSSGQTGISYTGRNWGPSELGINLYVNTWTTVESLSVATAVDGYVSCTATGSFDYDVTNSSGYGRVGWAKCSTCSPYWSEVIGGNTASNNTYTYDAFTAHFVTPHPAGTRTYYIRAYQTNGASGDMDIVISQASCLFIQSSVDPAASSGFFTDYIEHGENAENPVSP